MLWRGPIGGGAASGRAGALVASRARTTQYLRARVTPVNPRTVFQADVRNAVKTLTNRWTTTVDPADRTDWNVYGQNVSRRNRIGDSIHIAGISWYVANNVPRIQAGLPPVDTWGPISEFNLGNPTFVDASFTAAGTTGTFDFGDTVLPVESSTLSAFILYASKPYNPGRAAPIAGNRICAVIPGNTTETTHTFTLPWSTVSSNSQMNLIVRLSREDGRLSSPFTFPFSP